MTTSLNYMSSSVVRIHSTYNINIAGWTSSASYWVHTPESVGSNPTPATIYFFTSAWEIRAGFLNFYILAIYSLFLGEIICLYKKLLIYLATVLAKVN